MRSQTQFWHSWLCMTMTFEILKQKADMLEFAFSASTNSSPFSSSRQRYLPVVMWRIRKDCPHLMWPPLQLPTGTKEWAAVYCKVTKNEWLQYTCCQIKTLTRYVMAPVSIRIEHDCIQPLLHNEQLWKKKNPTRLSMTNLSWQIPTCQAESDIQSTVKITKIY